MWLVKVPIHSASYVLLCNKRKDETVGGAALRPSRKLSPRLILTEYVEKNGNTSFRNMRRRVALLLQLLRKRCLCEILFF